MTRFTTAGLLVIASLALAVQLAATPVLAQSSTGQNLLRNGDFSDGLTGWTPGVLRPSDHVGYPRWGLVGTVGTSGTSLSAYLDVSGGGAAYLESNPFLLPQASQVWTLNATLWGTLNPAVLQIEVRTQRGAYILDSLEPPRVQQGEQPIVKNYRIPLNFSGQDISLRFSCADIAGHANGVYCAFAGLAVSQAPAPNLYAALIMVAAGLGLAAGSVALAHGSSSGSSGTQGQGKPGLHFPTFLRPLALALLGYLSKKYCCACAGTCNHTGPHSFCPAHNPSTLAARMEVVYKVYCRYCGRKLEEHECSGPISESERPLLSHRPMERWNAQDQPRPQ